MKKITFILSLIALTIQLAHAQNYMTKTGVIDIFSETSMFKIEGKSQSVGSILNTSNGQVVATVVITGFKFKEALLEEHFNENYMESHKFPKAVFKGQITNWSMVNLAKDGSYSITLEGDLTMHGETRPVKTQGTLVISGGKIKATTEFIVSLENYKIKVEESYKDRINDSVKLTIHFDYTKME
jgi:polyisoprenoid-binding protein YceI